MPECLPPLPAEPPGVPTPDPGRRGTVWAPGQASHLPRISVPEACTVAGPRGRSPSGGLSAGRAGGRFAQQAQQRHLGHSGAHPHAAVTVTLQRQPQGGAAQGTGMSCHRAGAPSKHWCSGDGVRGLSHREAESQPHRQHDRKRTARPTCDSDGRRRGIVALLFIILFWILHFQP